MKKLNFAICDLESVYACRLMDYIRKKQKIPFEMLVFSGIESLRLFAEENSIELLLISSEMMCQEVKQMNIGQIIILSEGEVMRECEEYPAVYKYQASDSLVSEVMDYYASSSTERIPYLVKNNSNVIGIYSPIGRCGKTSFALTLGQILAQKGNTLYINIEDYSGFEKLMEKEYTADLTDLMYFVRLDKGNVIFKINAVLQHIGDLAYIPPILFTSDLREVKAGEWCRMLDAVTSVGGYENVVLDIGGELEEKLVLLDYCNQIYTPVCKGVHEKAKVEQYEKLLRELNAEVILEKTEYLHLPYTELAGTGEYYLEQLVKEEMGDFVRSLLQKKGSGK